MMDIERLLFESARADAIARLFGEDDGGCFTTEEYADSYSRVCSKNAKAHGSNRFPPITHDLARSHLTDCEYVVLVGKDRWMATDSRETNAR